MLNTQKINWKEVLLFYAIAVGVSAPFRLRLIQPEQLFPLPFGLNALYAILRGIGPLVGFLVVIFIAKSEVRRSLSFTGVNARISWLAAGILPLGLTIIGVPDEQGTNHYLGFVSGLTLFAYAIAEEYGWRGYLQEALAPLELGRKVFLIGTMWYVWHLNFLNPQISLQTHVIHYFVLLGGAWGLLKVTEISLSILFASAVHLSFNILADARGEFNKRLIVLLVAVVVWTLLLRYLRKNKSVPEDKPAR